MDVIKFSNTLIAPGKKAIILPDENGYYTVVLGAYNFYNSAGEYYTAARAVKLFEDSSVLMRKIKNGTLYSELGHPKISDYPRQAHESQQEHLERFYRRVRTTEEKNLAAHIGEVWLDFEPYKTHPELNKEVILVMGKVKPFGPHAQMLKTSFETPGINTAFSVRGITENNYRNGRMERDMVEAITWDLVHEPGISVATKLNSPAMETRSLIMEDIDDLTINRTILINTLTTSNAGTYACEADQALSAALAARLTSNPRRHKLSDW